MTYNPQKAAQTIAFFAIKQGGTVNLLKAVKLVYMADRNSVELRGHPIQDEPRVSMPFGPVNSTTLNHINGAYRDNQPAWQAILDDRAGNMVGLTNEQLSVDELDQLSPRELAILENLWSEFGHMSGLDLADWTHDNLVEWEDPNGSSRPITLERIMTAVGLEHSIERAREYESLQDAHDILASL
jgi:uncharacterized phage-associated protein